MPKPPSLALRHHETTADGIRRICGELIDDALWRLENAHTTGIESAVHETRKRCKETRGVLRLARGGLGEAAYRDANATLRDAARLLSGLRDEHAMLNTFDALVAASVESIPAGGVGAVRGALRERALAAGRASELRQSTVTAAGRLLRTQRTQVDTWDFDGDDDQMLALGLGGTYARARGAMAAAEATSDPHMLHDWRKRVKYGLYHTLVLEPAAPSVLTALAKMRHHLSSGLGDLHDLDIILDTARANVDEFGGSAQVESLGSITTSMQHELERRVFRLGRRLYAESVDGHVERMLGYLTAWREAGDELPVGAISEIFDVRDGLDELKKPELRALAHRAGITTLRSMGRKELLATLRASGLGPPQGVSDRSPDRDEVGELDAC